MGAGGRAVGLCARHVAAVSWLQLHTIAAYYPESPSEQEKEAARRLFASVSVLYPCPHCAADFVEAIAEQPPDVESRRALVLWTCEQHNRVNAKLGACVCSRGRAGSVDRCRRCLLRSLTLVAPLVVAAMVYRRCCDDDAAQGSRPTRATSGNWTSRGGRVPRRVGALSKSRLPSHLNTSPVSGRSTSSGLRVQGVPLHCSRLHHDSGGRGRCTTALTSPHSPLRSEATHTRNSTSRGVSLRHHP
jgi:FAD-linked sulfhydryl oxidase